MSRYGAKVILVGSELRIVGALGGMLWTLTLESSEPSKQERYEMLGAADLFDVPYGKLLDAAAGMSAARFFE